MRNLTKGLSWPFLILALATWAVFLAGVASLQNICADGTTGTSAGGDTAAGALQSIRGMNRNTGGLENTWGFSAGPVPCARLYRFYWFMVAFQFVVLVGAMITAATAWGLHYSRPFWIGMFSIATLLMMIASEAFLAGLDADRYSGGDHLTRMRLAAAGAIMTAAANIFLLFSIGTDWEGRKNRTPGKGEMERGGIALAPVGTPVAEPVGVARV